MGSGDGSLPKRQGQGNWGSALGWQWGGGQRGQVSENASIWGTGKERGQEKLWFHPGVTGTGGSVPSDWTAGETGRTVRRLWAGRVRTEDLGRQVCLCYTVKYTISPTSPVSGLWLVMLFLSFCHTLNPRTFLWPLAAAVGFQSNSKVHAGGRKRRPFLNEITGQLAGVSQRKHCISWYFASFPVSYSSLLLCLCLYLSVSLFLFIFWTELD